MTLIVVHLMILRVIMEGISKAATVLSALMKVCTIPCHDRGHINVMLVLQSSSNSLHILPSTSSETNAASSDCACHIGNMKVEEDFDMQEEEEEVNVKTEKGIGGEEDECIGIKDEEVRYSEEEEEEEEDGIDIKEEEGQEDGIDIKEEEGEVIFIEEEECVDIKKEVSLVGTM